MDNGYLNLGSAANLFTLSTCDFPGRVQLREDSTDVTLRLNSPSSSSLYSSKIKGAKRMWGYMNGNKGSEHPLLALGLGQSLNPSDSRTSSIILCKTSIGETDEHSIELGLDFQPNVRNVKKSNPSNSLFATVNTSHTENAIDLELSLSVGPSESVMTSIKPILSQHQGSLETSEMVSSVPTTDEEGTASSSWIVNSCLEPSLHNSETNGDFTSSKKIQIEVDPVAVVPEPPSTMAQTVKSPVVCTSTDVCSQHHNSNMKNCQFQGCVKRARGASGLCIAHGGGRRCQKPGCQKGAEGRTIFCKAHGGGRRCEHLGCTKSAEGRTDYCIAHGGGRRCGHDGCSRAARDKSGLCIRHGGGKRCQRENCTKSAEGYSRLCISHGGGRRCQFPACSKGAQGSTMFCKAHGGGKRCSFSGCTKGAEGSTPFCKGHGGGKRCSFQGGGVCPKSVHGGTLFCVAHGGGKRCAILGCTKSARGRTSFCVRHGGGKRCKSMDCRKSAQGNTDFCKAHGGGKRCAWDQAGSKFGTGDAPCDRFSRTKAGLCAGHDARVQDHCVRGGGTIEISPTKYPASIRSEKMKDVAVDGGKRVFGFCASETEMHSPLTQCRLVSLPEGRVHGGSLMAILATSSTGIRKHNYHGKYYFRAQCSTQYESDIRA
ncbi:unnamed protein product [Musa hybrid cultivar]